MNEELVFAFLTGMTAMLIIAMTYCEISYYFKSIKEERESELKKIAGDLNYRIDRLWDRYDELDAATANMIIRVDKQIKELKKQ